MSYLPYRSLAHKFLVRMPGCKVPESLSTVGWNSDSRVRIIPDQFCGVFENTKTILHSRQHWMPHNRQVATTIQTMVIRMDRISVMESFTIISTSTSGLYKSNYQFYQDGVDKCHLKVSLKQEHPQTLEWIRNRLLEDDLMRMGMGEVFRMKAIYRPIIVSGVAFFV
jgi:hypothetical protein